MGRKEEEERRGEAWVRGPEVQGPELGSWIQCVLQRIRVRVTDATKKEFMGISITITIRGDILTGSDTSLWSGWDVVRSWLSYRVE